MVLSSVLDILQNTTAFYYHRAIERVGAAKNAMMRLKDRELINEILNLTKPTLGICLGMQIFMDASMEEDTDCLGIISNKCKPFKLEKEYPVPHMRSLLHPHQGE